jgi:hypothetical protein
MQAFLVSPRLRAGCDAKRQTPEGPRGGSGGTLARNPFKCTLPPPSASLPPPPQTGEEKTASSQPSNSPLILILHVEEIDVEAGRLVFGEQILLLARQDAAGLRDHEVGRQAAGEEAGGLEIADAGQIA